MPGIHFCSSRSSQGKLRTDGGWCQRWAGNWEPWQLGKPEAWVQEQLLGSKVKASCQMVLPSPWHGIVPGVSLFLQHCLQTPLLDRWFRAQSPLMWTGNVKIVSVDAGQREASKGFQNVFSSVQFSSVAQSCPTLCDPMNRSTPGLPVHPRMYKRVQKREKGTTHKTSHSF